MAHLIERKKENSDTVWLFHVSEALPTVKATLCNFFYFKMVVLK